MILPDPAAEAAELIRTRKARRAASDARDRAMELRLRGGLVLVGAVGRRCSECAAPIAGRRDRVTCSARCRVARARRLGDVARRA